MSATAATNVQEAVTVDNPVGLRFGTVARGTLGGAITINARTGAVSTVGDVVAIPSPRGRAEIRTTGPVGALMVYSGDPVVTMTRQGGTEELIAMLTYAPGSGLANVSVLGSGLSLRTTGPEQTVLVGGQLVVAPDTLEGQYVGTFEVTAQFL